MIKHYIHVAHTGATHVQDTEYILITHCRSRSHPRRTAGSRITLAALIFMEKFGFAYALPITFVDDQRRYKYERMCPIVRMSRENKRWQLGLYVLP